MPRDWIPHRHHVLEVAGAAAHGGMQIVGHFFVVGQMALAAIARLLIAVAESSGLRVTDQAGDIPVGRLLVACRINQGKNMRWLLCGIMAVKTKFNASAHGRRIVTGSGQMAIKAWPVFLVRARQPGLKFMAQAAFNRYRPAEVRSNGIFRLPKLVVRVVARQTVFKILPGRFPLSGMAAFGQLNGCLLMAGRALVGSKKILQRPVHIDRIRMQCFLADVAVAIQAGQLAVYGHVIALTVKQPRRFCSRCHSQKYQR